MANSFRTEFNNYSRSYRRKKRLKRIVSLVAAIVVFITTYALILPAITMSSQESVFCGKEVHKHDISCYQQRLSEKKQVRECTADEAEVDHIHTNGCYTVEDAFVAPDELTCPISLSDEHKHSEMCYGVWDLVCGITPHIHELACYSNPEADIESAEDIKNSVAKAEIIGVRRDDIVSVALTQLGYTESKDNYSVLSDGVTKSGYTRYGDWYGNKYGAWDGMFVSFCLYYAGIDKSLISYNADSEQRALKLAEDGYFHSASGDYKAKVGDLIFFDYNKSELNKYGADHIGIVCERIYDKNDPNKLVALGVIEGDVKNSVVLAKYNIDDENILGYGEIPERKISFVECDCGTEAELYFHTEFCARRSCALEFGNVTHVKAIYRFWQKLPEDVREMLLSSLAEDKLNLLNNYIANGPEYNETFVNVSGLEFSLSGPLSSSMEANVSEITDASLDELKEYLNDDGKHLVTGAYDISVVVGEEKAYFDDPVKVAIAGLGLENVNPRYLKVKVYHLVDVDKTEIDPISKDTQVEVMDAGIDEDGSICFETDGFSVFYFTVDFHYEDITYLMDGYSSIYLSELFDEIDLPVDVNNVTSVEFSNEKYVSVSQSVNEEGTASDWVLTSKEPFSTTEQLTIKLADGTVISIDVTDNQTEANTVSEGGTINVETSGIANDDTLVVTLYKNGVSTGKTLTLSKSNSWEGSFTNLEAGNYSLQYGNEYYIYGVITGGDKVVNWNKVSSFTNGKTYVLLHNSSYAPQASSSGTSLSRGSVTVRNNTITSSVSDNMKWYYDGALKNVGRGMYLDISSGASLKSNAGSSVTIDSNGRIKLSTSNRYFRYNNSYSSTTSTNNITTFTLYEEDAYYTTLSYKIVAERITYNPKQEAKDFEHNKTIDDLGDGVVNPDTNVTGEDYYRLYLDMTGKSEPIDLLIVVDASSSMETADMDGSMRRDDAITKFLNGSTTQVTDEGFISYFLGLNSQNNVAVVQFYGLVDDIEYTSDLVSKTDVDYTHDSEILLDWTRTSGSFVDCECKTRSGTNYEAGLLRATEALASESVRNNGHRKVMIFLSDGVPTLFQINANDIGTVVSTGYVLDEDDVGKRWAKGVSTTYSYCKDPSKRAFDDFQQSNPGVTVFTVGVSEDINAESEDNNQSPDVLKYMAEQGHGEFYGIESNMSELKLRLESIFYPKSVVMTDELSKYVRYNTEDPDLIVSMKNNETNQTTVLFQNGSVTTAGSSIVESVTYIPGDTSAVPTESTGTVVAKFKPSYQFLPEYTYTLSYNVKNTQTAYNEFAFSDGYNAKGDANTDYGTNNTSSNKDGFYSNNNAIVEYIVFNEPASDTYDHPVVQVETESLIVKKQWQDSYNADDHAPISVALLLTYIENGEPQKTQIGSAVELGPNNNWQYRFDNLSEYHVLSPDYEYIIEEVNVPEGYEVVYSNTTLEDGTANWVVTNRVGAKLELQKVDEFGNPITVEGITFELYGDEELTVMLGEYATDANGRITINDLVDGKTYWLKETEGPMGYKIMDGAQPLRLQGGIIDSTFLLGNKYLSASGDVLYVKNFMGYELPSTGGTGTALITALGVVIVLGTAWLCYSFYRKRNRKVYYN